MGRQWEPKTSDSDALSIDYKVEDQSGLIVGPSGGIPEGGVITIDISRSLQATWGLGKNDLEGILLYYAKDYASSRAEENIPIGNEEYKLSTYNAPDSPPVSPDSIEFKFPYEFEVEITEPIPDQEIPLTELARSIITLRDNINALFGEIYKSRILTLPQERALAELSRPCSSIEEFAFRVSSLSSLATAIETTAINEKIEGKESMGSVDKFAEFLRVEFPEIDTSALVESLVKFNHVRRMFPIHTDRSRGVIQALSYFGIEYPVINFQGSMQLMNLKYEWFLKEFLKLLQGDY